MLSKKKSEDKNEKEKNLVCPIELYGSKQT